MFVIVADLTRALPFVAGRSQAIFRAVCLRRTKQSERQVVDLPPKKTYFVRITLSDVERRLYGVLAETGRVRDRTDRRRRRHC